MNRAPFVMGKAESAFSRNAQIYDTTIGWRFVNKLMKEKYGVDAMPETAENVAGDYSVSRADQDKMALASQLKAVAAHKSGYFDEEITPVTIPQKKGEPQVVSQDEHPRETTMEILAKLKGVVRPDGSVTAGNASGVNDGACAMLIATSHSRVRSCNPTFQPPTQYLLRIDLRRCSPPHHRGRQPNIHPSQQPPPLPPKPKLHHFYIKTASSAYPACASSY